MSTDTKNLEKTLGNPSTRWLMDFSAALSIGDASQQVDGCNDLSSALCLYPGANGRNYNLRYLSLSVTPEEWPPCEYGLLTPVKTHRVSRDRPLDSPQRSSFTSKSHRARSILDHNHSFGGEVSWLSYRGERQLDTGGSR